MKGRRFIFGLLGVGFLLTAVVAQASLRSQSLTQQGYQHLTRKHFERALNNFEAASRADHKDGAALFFEGVTLNRLGRFGEAGAKLDLAASLGKHPDWAFGRGWAHLGQSK